MATVAGIRGRSDPGRYAGSALTHGLNVFSATASMPQPPTDSGLASESSQAAAPPPDKSAPSSRGKQATRATRRGDDTGLWTVADVAEFFQVSESWVRHAASARRLPSLKIGGLLRFDPKEIRRLVAGP